MYRHVERLLRGGVFEVDSERRSEERYWLARGGALVGPDAAASPAPPPAGNVVVRERIGPLHLGVREMLPKPRSWADQPSDTARKRKLGKTSREAARRRYTAG